VRGQVRSEQFLFLTEESKAVENIHKSKNTESNGRIM
jgi:hypothetical protein